jgi:hypothetical protein
VELEGVDEEVVESYIEGRGDEEHVSSWAHNFCWVSGRGQYKGKETMYLGLGGTSSLPRSKYILILQGSMPSGTSRCLRRYTLLGQEV